MSRRLEYLTRFFAGAQQYGVSSSSGTGPVIDFRTVAFALRGVDPMLVALAHAYLSPYGKEGEAIKSDFLHLYAARLRHKSIDLAWPSPLEAVPDPRYYLQLARCFSWGLVSAERCPVCQGRGIKKNQKPCDRCKGEGHKRMTGEALRRLTPFTRYEWSQAISGKDRLAWKERAAVEEQRLWEQLVSVEALIAKRLNDERD